mmetsp:Transcript_25212/g.66958  ORF Transcript_25212/g.66958 Transcript_25212/m.66958 type:complete len:100 (-) Transcript_25212:128-427(-)
MAMLILERFQCCVGALEVSCQSTQLNIDAGSQLKHLTEVKLCKCEQEPEELERIAYQSSQQANKLQNPSALGSSGRWMSVASNFRIGEEDPFYEDWPYW